jgi:hypothetical protein
MQGQVFNVEVWRFIVLLAELSEKVNPKKSELTAITFGTSNRGAKERGWVFNSEFLEKIKKQNPTPQPRW